MYRIQKSKKKKKVRSNEADILSDVCGRYREEHGKVLVIGGGNTQRIVAWRPLACNTNHSCKRVNSSEG